VQLVQHDVVIVGASVTGSAVALLAREEGLTVALVDVRSRERLGDARGPTPVPSWALESSRLPIDETIRVPAFLHLVAGSARATLAAPDCVLLEPGAFVASLVDRAASGGASLYERARVVGLAARGDGVELEGGTTLRARFVIDASGSEGAALLGHRAVEPADVASIAQETRAIDDRRLADAYLDTAAVARGESVAFLAPAGPGSLVVVRVSDDARTAFFEAVTFSDDRERHRPTARAAIRRIARGFPWLGETIAEEARHVALGGLRDTLAAGNVALAGAAAGLTRPGLGGEFTFGIVTARLLVDALASSGDLSRYERRVRARFEKVAELDAALGRWFRSLDEEDLAFMLKNGAIGEPLIASMLEQRVARIPAMRFAAAAVRRKGRAAIARALEPLPRARLAKLGGRG
jgi:flavin-dependent dehydrogenase